MNNIKLSLFLLLFISLLACSCSSTQDATETPVLIPIPETTDKYEYNNDGNTKFGYTLVDGVDLIETERGIILVVEKPVRFELASSKIATQYNQSFEALNAFINKNESKIKRVVVEGHTDSIGTKAKNIKLSQSRSINGVNKSANTGVSRSIMRNSFVADNVPEYYGNESYKNRRIEFVIMGDEDDITQYNNFLANL